MLLRSALLTVAMVAVISLQGSALAATPAEGPRIEMVTQDALSVKAKEGKDTATASLSILNPGDEAIPIRVEIQGASSKDIGVASFEPSSVTPGGTRVEVGLKGLSKLKRDPVEGQLIVLGGPEPVARAFSITPAPEPSHDWPAWILWGSLFTFLALIGFVLVRARKDLRLLRKSAPGPKWSFDSWATTLTAAGAILGTVLGSATLPEIPRQIGKDELVGLNLLFGALVVVGPFIFQALRRPKASAADQEDGKWGYNATLLLSCTVTGAAVTGELATLALLGWELTESWLVPFATGLLAVLAFYYFVLTTQSLVTTDWDAKDLNAKKAAAEATRRQIEGTIVNGGITYTLSAELALPPETKPTEEQAAGLVPGRLVEPLAVPRQLTVPQSWPLP